MQSFWCGVSPLGQPHRSLAGFGCPERSSVICGPSWSLPGPGEKDPNGTHQSKTAAMFSFLLSQHKKRNYLKRKGDNES